MPVCKIKRVHTDPTKSPFLANFESSLQEIDINENIKTHIFEKGRNTLIAVPTRKCVYSGQVSENDNSLCRTLIAVRKKGSNKVVLVEARPVTLSATKRSTNIHDETTISTKENIRELNKQFGTKKAKRATELMERMKIDIGTVKQHLETTIAGVDTSTNTTEIEKGNALNETQAYQPPINRQAETFDEAFKLSDYITPSELNEFKNDAEKLLKSTFDDIQNCCPYITEEIAKLQNETNPLPEEEKIKRVSLLLYAQIILNYLKTSVIKINQKSFNIYSNVITAKVRQLFAVRNEKNAYMRPASMRDKAICYVLALFFIINDRHFIDTEEVAASLKIPLTKIHQFSKVCGAQTMAKSRKLYEIRLPIPEYKIVVKKSARKQIK